MVFSSPRFFLFLAVLLALLALRARNTTKLHILLVASCLFYAAWDYRYLSLLLLVAVINYVCGARIAATRETRAARLWLAASIVASLGILAYFKYAGFFVANANWALAPFGWTIPFAQVLLPAGISFYTFKTMSYTIDIHRGTLAPARSLAGYATFVTFFPELIAGPIVRASVFLPQMIRPIGPTAERLRTGLSIFLLGLSKKLLIADPLATIVEPIFASPATYAAPTLWLGVLAYTFQIYCDFSGYTDMAIGSSKMIGYDLPQNFRMPYLSANVAEFWRRWHITLSTWLRDYLYIPLGGNRRGPLRTYGNLMITMLLGGLWHGASWNFVLWGGLHGAALAAHRWHGERRRGPSRLPRPLAIAATFFFVTLCWVPFRSRDWDTTTLLLARLFGFPGDGVLWWPALLVPCGGLLAIGHAIGVCFDRRHRGEPTPQWLDRVLRAFGAELASDEISGWYLRLSLATVPGCAVVVSWILAIYYLAPTKTSPFIYFQF